MPACVNQGCRLLVPNPNESPEFWYYELRARRSELESLGQGSTFTELSRSDLLAFHVVCPMPMEQTSIAKFLNHVDRQIRQYMRAKQRLIKLLEEQKQAIIQQAVTRGLDPDVRLKPSGVEWLGEIPEHWELQQLRRVAWIRVSNVDKHSIEGELPVRLCNYVDAYKNERITGSIAFMKATAASEEIARFKLQLGDVLITKDSEEWTDIGVPSFVEYTATDLVCGYHLAILRPRQGKVCGAYLLRILQTPRFAYQFRIAANGVTRYGLSQYAIKSAQVAFPSVPEQLRIVGYLDEQTRSFDQAMRVIKDELVLLKEFRTSLIADVVTGKLDVRKAAAALPEEPSPLEVADEEQGLITDDEVVETEDQRDQPEEADE